METAQVTPQRRLPGVGVGEENKDSKYFSSYYVPLSAEKNYDKSPYHRAALGEHPRSALLSGAQRVIVKNTKSPSSDVAHQAHTQRGMNNFMKPTESSRISSTPIRSAGRLAPSPGRSSHTYAPITPAGDSANIMHFVSPVGLNTSPNLLMTPTRAQSTGRIGSSAGSSSAGRGTSTAAHRVTPSTDDTARKQHSALSEVNTGDVGSSRRSALASPPGRIANAVDVVPGSSTQQQVATDFIGIETSPKRGTNTNSRRGMPSYLQPTASSQMLFSPEYQQRVIEQSPQAVKSIQTSAGPTSTAAHVRSTSAPKPRPRSLSSQMQAHADNLKAVALEMDSKSTHQNTAATVTATTAVTSKSPTRQIQDPQCQESACSPQQTSPQAGPAVLPSTTVPKLSSPTQLTGNSSGQNVNARSKIPNHPHAVRSVRSADALSANKAAKLAALAAHSHHSAHHPPAASSASSRVARYAQPTHSSAAATAVHTMSKPKASSAQSCSKTGQKVVSSSNLGIAARQNSPTHAMNGDEDLQATPTATPQRVTKLHKRPPTAAMTTNKKLSSEKNSMNRPALHSVERGTRTMVSASNKSKLPVKSSISNGKNGIKSPASDPRPSKYKTQRGSTASTADSAIHSDSIMQILDGPDSPRHDFSEDAGVRTSGGAVGQNTAEINACSFACELSCVEAGDEQVSLAGSIDLSDYNGFDELSNWSGQATPTQKLPATCAEVDGRTLGGGQPRGVGHAVALDMDSAKLVDACTAAFPRISVPALSNRNNGSNYDKRSKQNSAAHLPPSELETRLDNISMVEALNSFSPRNISNLSTFSQGTFQDSFAPIHGDSTKSASGITVYNPPKSEMSAIHHVPSAIYSLDKQGRECSDEGGMRSENAWAKEYSDFFPPEINLVDESSGNLSSSRDVSRQVNIVGALNFTGADFSNTSDCSLLQLPLEDDSMNSPLKMATIAASPVPQDARSQHHLHHQNHGEVGDSATSTVASASNALNQAMMISASTNYSISSAPTYGGSNLSLAHPSKIYRQFSENSQSCNISAITPGEGLTLTSSIDIAGNLSGQHSSNASDSRIHVGSSASSMVSNVLDKAMIASYSFDHDIVNDLVAHAVSESTTSVSPFLRPHQMTRSDSGFTPVTKVHTLLPAVENIRVRTMFSPPPPPEAHSRLPDVVDSTLTASQQFDSSVDAVFAQQHTSAWTVDKSTESLPPPPPPPIEQSSIPLDQPFPSAGSSAARALSVSERIRRQLLDNSSSQFNRLRNLPDSPSVSAMDVTPVNAEYPEPQSSPTGDLPTIPSFGSIQSLSLLCSTDSVELAQSGAIADLQREEIGEEQKEDKLDDVDERRDSQYDEDIMNMVDDFAEYQTEDLVNLDDDDEENFEEAGSIQRADSEHDRPEMSENDDDEVSDYDADPVDLPFVNASIQSMNTSRIGSGGGSTNASCSYSYTSSMDELHSVNPRAKSELWVLDNYVADSLRSSSTLPTVATIPSTTVPASSRRTPGTVYESTSSTTTAAQPLLLIDSFGGVACSDHVIPRSTQRAPNFVVREECYRSSRHANSSQPSSLTCPDPLAGQLMLMSPGMLSVQSKKSFRAMQSVFVPLECEKNGSDDEYSM